MNGKPRKEFVKAYTCFSETIRSLQMTRLTDDAAIVTAGLQHLAYLHIKTTDEMGMTRQASRVLFMQAADRCMETILKQMERASA